jgi:hypothetical protein
MAQARDAGNAPRVDDPQGIALLRRVLLDAGYTPAAVRETLSSAVSGSRDKAEVPLYLHMLRDGGPLATLLKLFLLNLEVPAEEGVAGVATAPNRVRITNSESRDQGSGATGATAA